MIRHCPHCGQANKYTEDRKGKNVKCRVCEKTFFVPYKESTESYWPLVILFLFIIVIVLICGSIICNKGGSDRGSSSSANRTTSTSGARTPEHNLAIINNRGWVSEDDISVRRFRFLLGKLDKLCVESKKQIADMTVSAQEILANKYGKDINLLSMMEEMYKTMLISSPSGGGNYAETLAIQITMWGTGG